VLHTCGPGLVKGSLLSFVVFGVYDILVLRQSSSRANKAGDAKNKSPTNDVTALSSSATNHHEGGRSAALPSEESKVLLLPSTDRCPAITSTASKPFPSLHSWVVPHGHATAITTPLYLHFGSGALSGFMFSLVLDAWDVAAHVAKGHAIPHRLNAPLLVRRAMHHSVGYATLFGSFEAVRRRLDEWSMGFFFVAGDDDHTKGKAVANVLDALARLGLVCHDDVAQSYDVSAIPLVNAFLAGGMAGQLHHVADHCTRHWRRSTATAAPSTAITYQNHLYDLFLVAETATRHQGDDGLVFAHRCLLCTVPVRFGYCGSPVVRAGRPDRAVPALTQTILEKHLPIEYIQLMHAYADVKTTKEKYFICSGIFIKKRL
jgi:hypothetical protein